jgi:hypothetical protein
MVCNHLYLYEKTIYGVVSYGRNFVVGHNNVYKCLICGKIRWKVIGKYKVIKNTNYSTKQLFLW